MVKGFSDRLETIKYLLYSATSGRANEKEKKKFETVFCKSENQ